MAAGVATLEALSEPGFYDRLESKAEAYAAELKKLADKYFPGETTLNRVGSMMTAFFNPGPVVDFKSAMNSDTDLYGQYFREMLMNGVWLAPSQFEAGFMSTAHTEQAIDQTIEAAQGAFNSLIS